MCRFTNNILIRIYNFRLNYCPNEVMNKVIIIFELLIKDVNIFPRRKILQNKMKLPCRIRPRPMLPDVHNPTNVMLDWWIIAVTRFAFTRRSRIDCRLSFDDTKEPWYRSSDLRNSVLTSLVTDLCRYLCRLRGLFGTSRLRDLRIVHRCRRRWWHFWIGFARSFRCYFLESLLAYNINGLITSDRC